jgi:hypothetical protein
LPANTVSSNICSEGHRIESLDAGGVPFSLSDDTQVIIPAREILCVLCGRSLESIRSEKPKRSRKSKTQDTQPAFKTE